MANSNTGKIVGVSILSLLLLGTATYFIIKGSKKRQLPPLDEDLLKKLKGKDQQKETDVVEEQTTTQGGNIFDAIKKAIQGSLQTKDKSTFSGFTFPIRFGQTGDNVKRLQKLLLTYDKNILPKHGDDGVFRNETREALSKIIAKNQVDNQADIDAIESKIKEKAGQLMSGAFINQSLGLKLF
jgi:hypothetical protein